MTGVQWGALGADGRHLTCQALARAIYSDLLEPHSILSNKINTQKFKHVLQNYPPLFHILEKQLRAEIIDLQWRSNEELRERSDGENILYDRCFVARRNGVFLGL